MLRIGAKELTIRITGVIIWFVRVMNTLWVRSPPTNCGIFAEAVQPQGVQIPLKTPSAWPPPPPPAMVGGLVQPDHPA